MPLMVEEVAVLLWKFSYQLEFWTGFEVIYFCLFL